jgi:Na+-translocating ferredoxin:NAD+ oxidoreductase subunit D
METTNYIVSMSPHIRGRQSIETMMATFIIGLVPASLTAIYFFGLKALIIMVLSMATAVIVEAVIEKATHRALTFKDYHALLIGLLLALMLPSSVPWWIPVVGATVAIVLGKALFGGLGNYPFNPAIVAWVVLRLSWPERMNLFFEPHTTNQALTPLMALKVDPGLFYSYDLMALFLGQKPGLIGTVSSLAVLIGGLFILYRGVIRWHIPISFFAGVALFALVLRYINPDVYPPVSFHLISGGVFFAAFFLAPEPVTSPVTVKGMITFGLLAGILTMIIRMWGAFPDGSFYAILIMNSATPLFNYLKPQAYGRSYRA